MPNNCNTEVRHSETSGKWVTDIIKVLDLQRPPFQRRASVFPFFGAFYREHTSSSDRLSPAESKRTR
ncbi:hypothetical protein WN55_03823 [Dufourea novaeangliae]|uniref:Uncharacterized protein n=1 Tax=Dufourea novaeangliae TaxID=178035 RepID=A0A154NYE0_DUFNO|nr:hypothetical protein WN55_03823 [Dufourea novaeangliae]